MDPIEALPTGEEDEITNQIIAGFKKYLQSMSTKPKNIAEAVGPQGTVAGAPNIPPLIPGSQSHAVFGTYDSLF